MKSLGACLRILAFVLAILSSAGFSPSAFAGLADSGINEFDKQEHFTVSAAIATGGYVFLRSRDYNRWESLVTGMALAAFIGTAKEVHDRQVDTGDIKADFIGALFGGGISITVDVLAF